MFDCKVIPAKNQLPPVLQVSGEATIQNIQQFKDSLVEGLNAHRDLTIDCSNVTAADFSCLQLLCSAHRTCQTLKLSPDSPIALEELIEPSGLARSEGCGLADDKQSCLWICNVTAS